MIAKAARSDGTRKATAQTAAHNGWKPVVQCVPSMVMPWPWAILRATVKK